MLNQREALNPWEVVYLVLNRNLRLMRLQIGRHALISLVGAALVIGGAGWLFFNYFSDAKSEISYQMCVGVDPKQCPKGLRFMKGDLDAVTERVEKQCQGYSRQSILLKEAPVQDCDCLLVEIKCSSA
jgi:hypothetical protein